MFDHFLLIRTGSMVWSLYFSYTYHYFLSLRTMVCHNLVVDGSHEFAVLTSRSIKRQHTLYITVGKFMKLEILTVCVTRLIVLTN